MRVVFERKPEVSDIGRLIDRLRKRAHDQRLDEGTLRRVPQAPRQSLQVPWRKGLRDLRLDTKRSECGEEPIELLLFGLAVHPIQRRRSSAQQLAGDGDVRENHTFFDQTMRIVARAQLDGANMSDGIDAKFRLRGVKIERSATHAGLMQRAVDIDQHEQTIRERPELAPGLGPTLA